MLRTPKKLGGERRGHTEAIRRERGPPTTGALVAAVLALIGALSVPALARAQAVMTVSDLTAPNIVGNSNKPATEGPNAFTIGGQVCNTGTNDIQDAVLYFGNGVTPGIFPSTTVLPADPPPYSGTFQITSLDPDFSDATRLLGTIAVGECLTLYWPVEYPTVDGSNVPLWGQSNTPADDLQLDFELWGTGIDAVTLLPVGDSEADSVTIRNEITAKTNKIQPNVGFTTITPGQNIPIGQQIAITFHNVDFGSVLQGFDLDGIPGPDYDLWVQPVGEPDLWDPDVLRLVQIDIELRGTQCGGGNPPVTLNATDQWYFKELDQYGNCNWSGDYTYHFIGLKAGSVTITPYQEAASGSDIEKYNGDYCGGDPAADPDICVVVTVGATDQPNVLKEVDKAEAIFGETVTYTMTYSNPGLLPVGDPGSGNPVTINDTVPTELDYVAGSATCSAPCTIFYSTDNGVSFATPEPATASDVTDLRYAINDAVVGGGSGTVGFQGVVNTNTRTLATNTALISIDGGPTITQDDAVTLLNPESDLSITKTDNVATADVGDALTYELLVTNAGVDGSLTGFTITDTLPTGVTVNSGAAGAVTLGGVNAADWSCTSDNASPQVISCTTTVALAAAGTTTISFTTDALALALSGTTVTNSATVTADPARVDTDLTDNTDTDQTDINELADLSITKTDNVATADVGDSLTYVLTVANAGPNGSGTGVTVADTLPTDVTVNGGAAAAVTLAGANAADWSCTSNALAPQGIACTTTASIASGGSSVFSFDTDNLPLSTAGDTLTNSAAVTADPAISDPNPGNNTDTDDTDVNSIADVSISKTDNVATAEVGDTLTYVLTVANAGPSAAGTGLTVTDTLPTDVTVNGGAAAAVTLAGANSADWSCTSNALAPQGISCTTTVSIAAAGSSVFSFDTDALAAATAGDTLTNTAVVIPDPTVTDPVPGNNTDTDDTDVNENADVSISKTDNVATAEVGDTLTYVLTVANAGPSAAGTGLTVTDTLPTDVTVNGGAAAAVTLAGANSADWSCTSNALAPQGIACTTTVSIAAAGSSVFSFDTDALAAATAGDTLTNTAVVIPDPTVTDPVPGNNTDTDDTDVNPNADLSITKDDGTATYTAGGNLTYTITAANAGPSDVVGATVTDTFPPQLVSVNWTCAGTGAATCAAAGSGNISELVNIPAGDTVVFTVNTQVIPGATVNPLVNTATVAVPVGTTDPTPGNNSDDDQDTPTAGPAVIGDRVWLDEDGDGVQDAGEDGIAGVTVELYDVTGTILIDTTTTDANGNYIFTGVVADDYVVRVDTTTLPAGLAANPTYDEDDGTVNPDAETAVTVAAGDGYDTADFGFNWVSPTDTTNPAPGATGMIGDRIWNDANGDGIQDPGEAGIGGVDVFLYDDANGDGIYGGVGDNTLTTTTDEAGNYAFDGIDAGAYVIEVDTTTLPGVFTPAPTGDPDGDGDNVSDPIVIAPGDVYVNGDFGYNNPTGSTIGDTIYLDVDGDGVEDGGEPGIPGVTVSLLDNNGDVIASTTTDANGNYSFPGLPDGDYTVVVTDTGNVLADTDNNTGDPDGGGDSRADITIAGGDDLDQDFGFVPNGHDPGDGLIGDTIFLDRDSSGTVDAGEGLEGVTVELYDSTGTTLLATTTTDSNGGYVFGGLDPAAIYVVRVDPTTLPNGGGGMINTVDPDGGGDHEASVDLLLLGGTTLDQDFGYEADTPNTVEGTIWEDLSGDGTQDAGETTGHAGVTVVLLDSNGNVVGTTTTDVNVDYSFEGLPDDTYTILVTDDDNVLGGDWKSDGPNAGVDGNSQVNGYQVNVAGGVTDSTGDFGYYEAAAAIGNFIWSDLDGDGIQDLGEPGIAGVPVTLTITYPNGDVVTVVTLTDGTGAYSFEDLLDENFNGDGVGAEPTYSVSVANPAANHVFGGVDQGGDDLLDGDDHTGVAAQPVQGVTDTTNPALTTNGIDFAMLPEVDLQLTKTDGPDPVVQGNNLVYTIQIDNLSGPAATNVTVVDTLDPNTSYVSTTASGGCVEAPAGTLTCNPGTVLSGGTRSFTITVTVALAAPIAGVLQSDPCDGSEDLCNTATVSATQPDPTPGNNTDDEPTNVVASFSSADLTIDKDDGQATYLPGGSLVYTITVGNNGPDDVVGATVTDTFPLELTNVSWTCAGTGAASCTAAGAVSIADSNVDIPVGDTVVYTVNVDVLSSAAANPLVNTATVSVPGGFIDPTPGSNSDDDQDTPAPIADLSIDKDDGVLTYTAGDVLTYTITVANAGPSDVVGATVADTFDADFSSVTWTCAGAGGASCTAAGAGDINDNAVDIPVGDSVVYTVTATTSGAATADPLVNVATVTQPVGTTDPTPGDNSDDDQDTLNVAPPVGVNLAIDIVEGSTIQQGGYVIYTVVVSNNGLQGATGVDAAITLDPNARFQVATDGACVETVPGSGTIDCTIGNLAAGASVTYDLIVYVDPAAPTAGSITDPDCIATEDLCAEATVAGNEPDTDLSDNTDDAPTDVIVAVDSSEISAIKTQLTADPIAPGGSVTYRFEVTNAGPDDAIDILVIDRFDPTQLIYVSDDAGCILTADDTLTCPLALVPAFTTATIDAVFTVDPSAPSGGSLQGPDCDSSEDVCNNIFASSPSPDPDPTDNEDSEPTDVSVSLTCGDGILDPGEECDPPSSEICNNGVDDDGDTAIDCADIDCAIPVFRSCTASCSLAPACIPILNDPAIIRDASETSKAKGKKGYLSIHGRVISTTVVNPLLEPWTILMTNEYGEIYRASVFAGDLDPKIGATTALYRFKDRSAKKSGPGLRGGIYKLSIKRRKDNGYLGYSFRIKAFGDMSKAISPSMTTQVYFGDDPAYITTNWSGRPGRWKLTPSDY